MHFVNEQQGCSHGGRRWAGPPGTLNLRPGLWVKIGYAAQHENSHTEWKKKKILQGLLHFRNILIH